MGRRASSNKKLPQTPITVTIESLAHDGRGVARVDGKVVFIDQALPGEQLDFIYTRNSRDYAEGKVITLHTRAAERAEPECPHFGVCGGCSLQHIKDEAQISIKEGLLKEQLTRTGKVAIPPLWQPLTDRYWGYRRKARMGVKYVAKKGRVLVGFRERGNPFLADIESCKVMHASVGEKLPELAAMIGSLSIKDKIPQIEVAIGDTETVLAVRVIQPPTDTDKELMKAFERQHKIRICLQAKGPDSIVPIDDEPAIIPTYSLPEQNIQLAFKPAMFTQVNYGINQKMVSRVIQVLGLTENDQVLDLFCGLGNFTLAMATKAGGVVGVEGDLPLVQQAKQNAQRNGLSNVDFFVADLTNDIAGQAWARQTYNKILFNPSRAGALEILPQLKHWQPEQIMYVSCNPSTLARDAGVLVNELGYKLAKAGVMDMFPHTGHIESIALFEAP